jgi:hypothetical protein
LEVAMERVIFRLFGSALVVVGIAVAVIATHWFSELVGCSLCVAGGWFHGMFGGRQ